MRANKKYIRKSKYRVAPPIPSSVEVKRFEAPVLRLKDNSATPLTVLGSTLLIGLHPCVWSAEKDILENITSYELE